jgi:hypothetical protein
MEIHPPPSRNVYSQWINCVYLDNSFHKSTEVFFFIYSTFHYSTVGIFSLTRRHLLKKRYSVGAVVRDCKFNFFFPSPTFFPDNFFSANSKLIYRMCQRKRKKKDFFIFVIIRKNVAFWQQRMQHNDSCLKRTKCAMGRVARFFLLQNTKTGENVPNYHKLYQMSIKYNKRP